MDVRDLKEMLASMDDEAEIRIAHQPSWPLRFDLAAVIDSDELSRRIYNDRDPDEDPEADPKENFVWLVASAGHPWDESPYAPTQLWQE